MSRMNARNRRRFFDLIVARDGGAYCFIGGETLTFETAVIDHLDNINSNNRLDNLHLLCRSMNCVKNCRGRDKRHKLLSPMSGNTRVQMFDNEGLRTNSVEIIKNLQAEPDFRHWLFWKIIRDRKVLFEDALDAGAAFARCSQETVRRYLKKEISEVRLYSLIEEPESKKKLVVFKPELSICRGWQEEKERHKRFSQNWKDDLLSGLDVSLDKAVKDELAEREKAN